jgi:hypothetical protein
MTNAEWLASFPGTAEQKKFLYSCVVLPYFRARKIAVMTLR